MHTSVMAIRVSTNEGTTITIPVNVYDWTHGTTAVNYSVGGSATAGLD
jgi:hypothetical protein